MTSTEKVPFPELKIVPVDRIFPHEVHDSQRSLPLLERIRDAEILTNPPIIAPIDDTSYVILDGANRYHCFAALGYRDLLVQVVDYESDFVDLKVWQHIISEMERVHFIAALEDVPDLELRQGWHNDALAQLILPQGAALALMTSAKDFAGRNRVLREVVAIYQQNAVLNRTALTDPAIIWSLYPDAITMVKFPDYHPADIIVAARDKAHVPPGISRHIIQGRALDLNYPLAALKDDTLSADEKNAQLDIWLKAKLEKRDIRYYAESTYQFNE